MIDHHCLYKCGWLMADWCDDCLIDYREYCRAIQSGRYPPLGEYQCRAAYEAEVIVRCDEPLDTEPPALPPFAADLPEPPQPPAPAAPPIGRLPWLEPSRN